IHAQIGRGIDGIAKDQFVEIVAVTVVKHYREVEVCPDRAYGRATVIPCVAQEGTLLDEKLACSRCEGRLDKVILARFVSHMRVIEPDLALRIKGILGDALDECAFPSRLAGDVTVISSIDGRDARFAVAKDIYALM